MIQRIQTFYLLLSLIFIGLIGWMPLGELSGNGNIYSYTVQGIENSLNGKMLFNGWPLMVCLGMIILINVTAIFGFKNRVGQMRMITYNIILMIGFFGVCLFFALNTKARLEGGIVKYEIAFIFPLISAILSYLAIRAIGKDEALVRSIDRIR